MDNDSLIDWLETMREHSIDLRESADTSAQILRYQGRINAFQAVLKRIDGREYPTEAWIPPMDTVADGDDPE